jgi:ABC-type cobalamin transport system permease subunit
MHGLADAILLIHALVVAFVVLGAAYIWIGVHYSWPGVRAPLFRYTHLGVMLFVAAQAVIGRVCPLTIWEDELRGEQPRNSFIAYWIGRLIYYDLPPWVFAAAYLAFSGALIVTLILLPPQRKK